MLIENSEVTKLRLSGIKGLDPISVFLESHGEGRGTVTLSCFGNSWSSSWGAMGENDVAKFFLSCDRYYLAGKFSSYSDAATEIDYEKSMESLKKEIRKYRRDDEFTKKQAREMYDAIAEYRRDERYGIEFPDYLHDALAELDDWYMGLSTKPTSDREYLWKIIDAAQKGVGIHIGVPKDIVQEDG